MTGQVLAAGGVLWRPAAGGVQVALVHRPRYDDWSLPKGKLQAGEHSLTAAVREVREETGVQATAGRTLGSSSYEVLQDGQLVPKTVRWWAMRAGKGTFTAGAEVDVLRWLPPEQAAGQLTAGRDVPPLRLLGPDPAATSTVLLVRHGRAGRRGDGPADDRQRPLDATGERQAAALAALLPAYGVTRLLSAPALRCCQTVAPLARGLGLPLEPAPALSEQGWAQDPSAARGLLLRLAAQPGVTVVCAHRGAVPGLVDLLAREAAVRLGRLRGPKGSVWALSFTGGKLVDADLLADPLRP